MLISQDMFHPVAHNPYFWVTLAGFWMGAAWAAFALVPRRRPSPERARRRKWVFVCLYLSFFFLSLLGAVMVLGYQVFLTVEKAWYFGAAVLLFFLALRFKKLIGIPMAMIMLVATLSLAFLLSPWHRREDKTLLCEYQILTADEVTARVEWRVPALTREEAAPRFVDLPADTTLTLPILRFHDWIWPGAGKFYQADSLLFPSQLVKREDNTSRTIIVLLKNALWEFLLRNRWAEIKDVQSDTLPRVPLQRYYVYLLYEDQIIVADYPYD